MPKVSPLQSNFNGGEFSPLLYGRVDAERYRTGLSTCLNYVPVVQGGATRRPATTYAAAAKDHMKRSRVVAFEFSTTQAYIIEFGDLYVRFYRNNGQILDAGVPYEVATPYLEADLFHLKFTQSADVLYITHPNYAPRKLSRTGHTAWTLTAITFLDGPYGATNTTVVTLTPSAATGAITITSGPVGAITGAADNGVGLIRITDAGHGLTTGLRVRIAGVTGTTEANGTWTITVISSSTYDLQGSAFINAYVSGGTVHPIVFAAGDVGRVVRMQQGTVWGYARITAFTHEGLVDADVVTTLTSTAAKTVWRLGLWSTTTGFPACSTFYEDRLFFAGATGAPQRLDGSRSGDYENFAPTDTDGTVTASHAVSFTLNSDTVNNIRWMVPDERALVVGSVGSEWIVRPSTLSEALSPTNISAKTPTSYGTADIAPVKIGKSTLFVQRAGRQLWELRYVFEVDGFNADDMTEIAEHITAGGIVEMDFQSQPHSILWAVRADGVLLGMTFKRQVDGLRVGWHRHTLGGFSDAAHTVAAKVESVAVIPSSDGKRDDVWVVVQRYINGGTKRYVERLTKFFEDTDAQEDAFFVDCGLTYDGAPATVISGLAHLEGETVSILADGAAHPERTVTAGAVTLTAAASVVHVGYGYNSDGQMLRLEAGAADGTALGKTRRVHRVGFLLHRSLGLRYGVNFAALDTMTFRDSNDPLDNPPALFSGIVSETLEADYDFENQICWRQDQPLPSTILAVMPQLVTQDRG